MHYLKNSYLITLSCCLLFTLEGHTQESTKLQGEAIGSISVDYTTGDPSQSVNTPAMAFDGNSNTIYASYERSNTYVGLMLDSPYIITKIGFTPRKNYASRVSLGVIEGANQPDFGDAVPLYVITEQNISDTQMNYASVNCSKGFRYVRYVGPNDKRCNIAELEFYGYPGNGDDTKFYQVTQIPSVIIHTENATDITSKEDYLKGIISFISNEGTTLYSDSLKIRGRGNKSWSFPKKPYKIKLYKKTNLLGNPAKAKEWTLINNYGDKTLMRNLVAFEFSRCLGLSYTPAAQPVDVFLNGEYKGCYQLCDQVEVNEKRVNIEKMDPATTSLPDLSGGYFIEVDAYANQEISWFQSAITQTPVTIKYPDDDEITPCQTQYITNHFNQLEAAILGNSDDLETGFQKYLDLTSFLKHFIVGELTANTDTYWSVYMYKHQNDDRFYVGPVWDFDLGFDNDNRTYPTNEILDNSGSPAYVYTIGSQAGKMRTFVNKIMSYPNSLHELQLLWSDGRQNKGLDEDHLLAYVDQWADAMDESQKLNFRRWNILSTKVHQNPVARGSYQAEVAYLKQYIQQRLSWMDKKIGIISATSEHSFTRESLYSSEGNLYLNHFTEGTPIHIYNLMGTPLYQGQISSEMESIPLNQKGIFVVQVGTAVFKITL